MTTAAAKDGYQPPPTWPLLSRTGPAVLRSLRDRTTRLPRIRRRYEGAAVLLMLAGADTRDERVPLLVASHVPLRGEAPSRTLLLSMRGGSFALGK